MTIARDTIAAYLAAQFSELGASVDQDTNPVVGFAPDIDNALRKLGKTESQLATATVEDGQREATFALAEYYAARRFWRQMASRVNRTTGTVSYNFAHQFKTLKEIMDDAAAKCALLGYDVSADGWTVGSLNLDWLEPEVLA